MNRVEVAMRPEMMKEVKREVKQEEIFGNESTPPPSNRAEICHDEMMDVEVKMEPAVEEESFSDTETLFNPINDSAEEKRLAEIAEGNFFGDDFGQAVTSMDMKLEDVEIDVEEERVDWLGEIAEGAFPPRGDLEENWSPVEDFKQEEMGELDEDEIGVNEEVDELVCASPNRSGGDIMHHDHPMESAEVLENDEEWEEMYDAEEVTEFSFRELNEIILTRNPRTGEERLEMQRMREWTYQDDNA